MVEIIWEVTGYYDRLADNGEVVAQTSLSNLVTNLRAIATYQKRHFLPTIHQSFGLSFLPDRSLAPLMRQVSGYSSLIANDILCPLVKNIENLRSQQFIYRFTTTHLSQNFRISLDSEDRQIPFKSFDHRNRCQGSYEIKLSPDSRNSFIQNIYTEAIQNLNQFIRNNQIQVIHQVLFSRDSSLFSISLPQNCTAWIQFQQLPQIFQRSISILRDNLDINNEPETVQELVRNYRQAYPNRIVISDRIPDLSVAGIDAQLEIQPVEVKIGKGNHRDILQNLINNAQKFLLICSYRIEDEEIVETIVEKSKTIPVWILTDFSNTVQDRVDSNMEGQIRVDPEYANADRKKRKCLKMLSRANIGFRSGDFHLKTYISEQSAYLGSCNLTGGSLGRNGEAGMLWHNTSEHQFLIRYFRYLWASETLEHAIPTPQGYRVQSIESIQESAPKHDRFLNHQEFRRDLSRSLQKFRGREICIYTRTFQPLLTMVSLLENYHHRIFYGAYNNVRIRASQIPKLHAKIIIIGSQIAYIGSQDCAFRPNPLLELTYKTTDPQEIRLIQQEVQNLH